MDPRRILEEAAQRRLICEIRTRGGSWARACFVRVEQSGVLITVAGQRFQGGEDVRIWLSLDAQHYTFEASVIRVGAPVPDRSQDGVLLGFIDRWTLASPPDTGPSGQVVELIPPNGPAISLMDPPVRLVELTVDGLSFTVPDVFKMIFVESGMITVRLGINGKPSMEVAARVGDLAAGEGYRLYGLCFEQVEDAATHQELVASLSAYSFPE